VGVVVGIAVLVGVSVGASVVVVTVMLSTRKSEAANGAYGIVTSTTLNGCAEEKDSVPMGIVSPP
jgi:hypothetical protein